MNTAEKIKQLRESHGLSQEALAEIIGVDRTTIVKYETGKSKPTRNLPKLADYFHVTTDELLGRDAPKAIPAKEAPAPPTILMRAEQDLPPEKRKLLEDMAKALLGSDEKIQVAPESSPSSPSTRTSTGRASTRTKK